MSLLQTSSAAATAATCLLALNSTSLAGGIGDACPGEWDPTLGETGFDSNVNAIVEYNGDLIVAGNFTEVNGQTMNHIARWDGTSWHALGDGFSANVFSLGVYDGELVASGHFFFSGDTQVARVAKWNGKEWGPLLPGLGNNANGLYEWDGKLIAGGNFTIPAYRIGQWDGSAWSTLGGGTNSVVRDFVEYEGDLIVCGSFTEVGTDTGDDIPANRIARWDGTQWHTLGPGPGGFSAYTRSVTVYNGELIAAGDFTFPYDNIARWDGTSWQPIGDGSEFAGGPIWSVTVFDGDLIASGEFTSIDGVAVNRIARWDGEQWLPLGDACPGDVADGCGMSGGVNPLLEHNDTLVVGGHFTTAFGHSVGRIAAWSGCQEDKPVVGDLNDDGNINVSDMLILLGEWGACGDCKTCPADLNGDCNVNVSDLLLLLGNWS